MDRGFAGTAAPSRGSIGADPPEPYFLTFGTPDSARPGVPVLT
jgi:hypothetical protein